MNRSRITFVIVVAMTTIACRHKVADQKAPTIGVEVQEVTTELCYDKMNFATQIEAIRSAVIQPRVDGFLVATHYQGGMPVRRGELLFTIDPSTYATSLYSARADLESARADELLAQRNYERAEPLAKIDAISESDLDQYRASYKSARAATKSAEEALRSAELQIGYTKIYAPISGIATKTSATEGDYIGIGTQVSELCTISQCDTITVELAIPTAKYLTHSAGGSFNNPNLLSDIALTLADSTLYPLAGEYDYTLTQSPSSSSTVVVVAKFPNPDLKLKEGMFARISANIGQRRPRLLVPRAAVSQLQGVNSLWVVQADSTAQWRKVELGSSYGEAWEITAGVEQGERVVVSGTLKLHNGMKVTATQAKAK